MRDRVLHLDLETRSAINLKERGLYVYAEHPSTEIILVSYAFDDEPVKTWSPGRDSMPAELFAAIAYGTKIYAHNAVFERRVWNACTDGPPMLASQMRCTMAMAYSMGIPPGLDAAAAALGLDVGKDAEGKALMLDMCRPQSMKADGTYVWRESEEDLERLAVYGRQDVEVSRAISYRLLGLSKHEQSVYELDQTINDRGLRVDTFSIPLALSVVGQEKTRLDEEMKACTRGQVEACTQVAALKRFVESHGIAVEGLGKASVVDLLNRNDLPGEVRQALSLRQAAAKSSVAKLQAMLERVSSDGRVRGTLQYHGSHTGRWAGRGIQPQNFPKSKYEDHQISDIFSLLKTPNPSESIALFYDSPLSVVSKLLRSFILADAEHTLMWGDFAGIEAKIIAWSAGEDFVLDNYRKGIDAYVAAYARSFNVSADTVLNPSRERDIGKVQVLSLGFQGGVDALQAMARNLGITLTDEEASRIKDAWRKAHPNIVNYWYELERKAIAAVRYPGDEFSANGCHPGRGVKFVVRGSFLFCRLPSGRLLTYPYPKLEKKTIKRKDGSAWEKECLSYMGEDSEHGRKWTRLFTYGGKLAENITQGIARDCMVAAMERVDKKFPVILTVHDEVVTEPKLTPQLETDAAEMKRLMEVVPEWCADLPITVEVKFGKRYRK